MNEPTDNQIFNHMAPAEECCTRCLGDNLKRIEYTSYRTYECLECGFEPEPPGEE